jgi:hypothetical protein
MQREELSCSGNLDTSNHIKKGKGRHGDGTVTGNLRFRVLTACWSLYFRRTCERNGNSAAIRKSIVLPR